MITRKAIKLIKSLHQKKYRHRHGLFLVEGAKSVLELLASSFKIETLAATELFLQTHHELLTQRAKDFLVVELSEPALSSLSSFKHNQSALAVVAIPAVVAQLPAQGAYGLVLDDVSDPGNLGTILRIADWYGIRQIVGSPATTDVYAPKVVSASMGSFLRVSVAYTDLVAYLQAATGPVYGGALDRGTSVHSFVPRHPGGIIVLGNESVGIQTALEPSISEYLHIPRYGRAESLNVGVATAIICDNLIRIKQA